MSTQTFHPRDVVFHAEHGPGRILEVTGSWYVIDFANKKGHRIDSDIAARSLELGSQNGLFANLLDQPDLIKSQIAQGNLDVVVQCLRDSTGGLPLVQIKKRLTPYLPEGCSWSKWWSNVQRRAKRDGRISIPSSKNKPYSLLEDIAQKSSLSLEGFSQAKDIHSRFKEALLAIKRISSNIESNEQALEPIRQYYSDALQTSQVLIERFFAAVILFQLGAHLREGHKRAPSDEFAKVLPLDSNIIGELKNEEERAEVVRLFLSASDPIYQQFLVRMLLEPRLNEGLGRQIVRRIIEESSFPAFLAQCDTLFLDKTQVEFHDLPKDDYEPPVSRLLARIANAIAELRKKPTLDSMILVSHITGWIKPSIREVQAASLADSLLSLCSELSVPTEHVQSIVEMLFFERTVSDRALSEWRVLLDRHASKVPLVEHSRRLLTTRLSASIFREEDAGLALRRYLQLTSSADTAEVLEHVLDESGSTLGEVTADWMLRQLRDIDGLDSYTQKLYESLRDGTAPSEGSSRRLLRMASRYAFPAEEVARLFDELYHLPTDDKTVHSKTEHAKNVLEEVSHSTRFITHLLNTILSHGSELTKLTRERDELNRLLEDESTIRQKAEPFIRKEVEDRLRLARQMDELQQANESQEMAALLQEVDSCYAQLSIYQSELKTRSSVSPQDQIRVEALIAQMSLIRNAVTRLAESRNMVLIGQRGESLSYDPVLHEDVTASQLAPGASVTCTAPGVVQKQVGMNTVIRKARVRSSRGGLT